jgi:hypothetical protein
VILDIYISPQRIADLIVTAVENNPVTRSWFAGMDLTAWIDATTGLRSGKNVTQGLSNPWYADPQLYQSGHFAIEIVQIADERTGAAPRHRRTKTELLNAFKVMAQSHRVHFSNFLAENEDATTANVFLQLFAFGDVIYR